MPELILQGLFLPGGIGKWEEGGRRGQTFFRRASHLRRDKALVFNRPGINSDKAEPCRSLNSQIIPYLLRALPWKQNLLKTVIRFIYIKKMILQNFHSASFNSTFGLVEFFFFFFFFCKYGIFIHIYM